MVVVFEGTQRVGTEGMLLDESANALIGSCWWELVAGMGGIENGAVKNVG